MSSFIPYQVDYTVQNTAKTLGFSKKKVIFKWGFANERSLADGNTGANCRGSEHELTFVWSLKTGKRQIWLDNRDVHFSESGQNGWTVDRAWQHAFTMKDATGTYRVHFVSQPKNPDIPDSKPFDLRVAGVSYFSFNHIYQLGTPSMVVRDNSRSHHRQGRDSPMTPEERRQIAQAKAESLRDLAEQQQKKSAPPPMPKQEPDLLSFDADPTPPPVPIGRPPQDLTTSAHSNGSFGNFAFTSSVSLDSALEPAKQPPVYGQPPYGGQQFAQPPPPPQTPQNAMASFSSLGQSYGQQPPPQYGQPSYAQPPVSAPVPPSGALTAYQPPTGAPAPSPYAMPPAPQQQQQQPFAGYGQSTGSIDSGFSSGPYAQPPQSMQSPSAQSYASYGSAPSFAQPPQQPAPQSPYGGGNFAQQSYPPSGYAAQPPYRNY